jgi:hypothetical protein
MIKRYQWDRSLLLNLPESSSGRCYMVVRHVDHSIPRQTSSSAKLWRLQDSTFEASSE